MKTFADVKRRFAIGVVLQCVENTYRPEINGQLRRIEIVQTNSLAFQHPQPDGSFLDHIERRDLFWSWFPASAKQVQIVDADTFRMPIGRGDHSVTLRFCA